MKCYKFKLYPKKGQITKMKRYLDVCRLTYNKALEYKCGKYEKEKVHVSEFDLNSKICQWRNTTEPWMNDCGVAILHDVSRRVEKAFKGFYKRVKDKSGKAGFPRFKGEGRIRSFTNPRFKFKIKDGKIRLGNDLGWVKINLHREVFGEPIGYTVSRNSCGEWFITTWVETTVHVKPFDKSNNIGIDLGCTSLITTSGGEKVNNARFFREKERELKKVQRKGRKDATAKIHKKIANKRADLNHQESRRLVDRYDLIFAEKIDFKSLERDTYKNVRKSMRDAGWNQFIQFTSYKAANAGKIFRLVNPAYTSQTCSNCGKIHDLGLKDRVMKCGCGYVEDRDVNAARNILALGLQGLDSS